jgi:peptidoglycan/LPS O-acetylase OafA/YrhL
MLHRSGFATVWCFDILWSARSFAPDHPGIAMPDQNRSGARLPALDGLRGIAALVVVLFHIVILSPVLGATDRDRAVPDGTGWWAQVLTHTPVKLLWSGDEAVDVFFVLSGLVLTLPFLTRRFDLRSYLPRRFLRLYLPVWGSIVLALLARTLVPRVADPDWSWWLSAHAVRYSVRAIGGDATLLIGTSWANSVLWSLRWEVWFSLLLPVLLLVFVRWPRFAAAKLVVLLALIEAGTLWHSDELRFLPLFGIGMVLALHLDRVRVIVGRMRGPWSVLLPVLAAGLLTSSWLTNGSALWAPAVAAGAGLTVVLFAGWPPAIALGTTRVCAWLGRISFSLYLVHEPLVVSVALLVGPTEPLLVLPIALPAALLLGWGFFLAVERPSHRLANRVARWASHRGQVAEPVAVPS